MFAFLLTFVAVGQALIGVAATTEDFTEIKIGSSLHADSRSGPTSWPSPSGRFAFGFYKEGQGGFSIGISMYTAEPLVIWTAKGDFGTNTFSNGSVLYFTQQGLLLTPNNGSKSIYLINSAESTGAAMLDSGNFIVYYSIPSNPAKNCSSKWRDVYCITWQSFDYPTDTMMEGQVLPLGIGLTSRENTVDHSFYMLNMQYDSNLVLYSAKNTTMDGNTTTDENAIWATMTQGEGYTQLIFTEDGRLFLNVPDFGSSVQNLSLYYPNEGQANTLYYATLTPTKYFQLFQLNLTSNESTVVYEIPTNTNDCDVKTLCGMNSYCLVINNRTDCSCLPGFDFTDFRDRAKGCKRSIAEPNCSPAGSTDTTAFSMEPVENLQWFDEAYSLLSVQSKEDCSSSCLAECDCQAALFFNQNCEKHKLPLSRATKSAKFTADVSTAYIKISADDSGRKAVEKPKRKVFLVAVLLCGAINVAVFLALLVAGIGSYWFFYGRYRLLWHKWDLAFQEEVAPRSFSFQELAKATNSFSTELGKGGHATVFMGYLRMHGRPNPVPVAVKRLSAEEGKAEVDFQAEIRIIGRAHHVNLVRLLGFCYEESKRLLIYEYMSRGSLGDLIWRTGPPNWKQQTGILLGVARGINYLHRECETQIIHRDIKPENILIADNFSVKISDFGISKLSVGGLQAMSTKWTSAPGTPGYMAPECAQSKGENATEKADVYSFGIVVLETVFWERNTEDNNLLDSASKYLKDIEVSRRNEVELTDAELEKEMMVMLGLLCVQQNPDARPYMEEVIMSMLEGVMNVPSVAAAVTAQIITFGKKISWAPQLEKIQDV